MTNVFELARAIVSAFSNRGEEPLHPVSTLAVRHEFLRRNRTENATDALETLAEVRDLVRLPNGYWLPTPTHIASGTSLKILVSGTPTDQLPDGVVLASNPQGVSRLVAGLDSTSFALPTISIGEWHGMPLSAQSWLARMQNSARFSPLSTFDDIEVYRHWPSRTRQRWLPITASGLPGGSVMLGRRRGRMHTSYTLVQHVAAGRLETWDVPAESEIVIRIMCALRSLSDPPKVNIGPEDNNGYAKLDAELVPREERRLLKAIGHIATGADPINVSAKIHRQAIGDVSTAFIALGCKVQRSVP